MLQSSSG